MKMIAKPKRGGGPDHAAPEQLPGADWSQVTVKPQPGRLGLPLPGSVQHPLWIQPRLRRPT